MPRFKCVACKTRLSSPAGPPNLVGDLCPECGSLLEPVSELSEVVGFRAIKRRESSALGEAQETHARIADRLDDFLDRRRAILAQARLDAQHWVDDEGSFRAEAVAVPAPPSQD
jgi:hypothetical protein